MGLNTPNPPKTIVLTLAICLSSLARAWPSCQSKTPTKASAPLLVRGPPTKAAFAADGSPTKALEGFCKKNGVAPGDVTKQADAKGVEYVFAKVKEVGRPAAEVGVVLAALNKGFDAEKCADVCFQKHDGLIRCQEKQEPAEVVHQIRDRWMLCPDRGTAWPGVFAVLPQVHEMGRWRRNLQPPCAMAVGFVR
eukprot:1161244-Pelagomonas_calceolata.AAC.11